MAPTKLTTGLGIYVQKICNPNSISVGGILMFLLSLFPQVRWSFKIALQTILSTSTFYLDDLLGFDLKKLSTVATPFKDSFVEKGRGGLRCFKLVPLLPGFLSELFTSFQLSFLCNRRASSLSAFSCIRLLCSSSTSRSFTAEFSELEGVMPSGFILKKLLIRSFLLALRLKLHAVKPKKLIGNRYTLPAINSVRNTDLDAVQISFFRHSPLP